MPESVLRLCLLSGSSKFKGKKKVSVSRADSIRVLVLVTIVASVPILGTIFVTASTSEPDLSELSPINRRAGQYVVLDWSTLLLQHQPDDSKTGTVIPAGSRRFKVWDT